MSLKDLGPVPAAPEPPRGGSRFRKVMAVLVLLVVVGGIATWYSTTPAGNLETQQLSLAWSQWSASLAPPQPNVHPGLIHPSQGPNESVFFFATTSPTVGTYAMESGDEMFGDSLTIYAFTPLAHNTTQLVMTSYSPTTIYVKDPKTNFTTVETQYNVVNSTTKATFPALASFDQQSVDLPITSQTQLVKVTAGGQEVFEFYHHTLPSYLAVPPSTQGELFAQTEEFVLGALVVAGLALAFASATAKRTGYIPSMGRWGFSGAIALIIMGLGVFHEYQGALTLNTVPYTLIPSFVGFYFLSLQLVKPPTTLWFFLMPEVGALRPEMYLRQRGIIPSSEDEDEPRVATDSWRDFLRGKYTTLRFVKEERELEKDDDALEKERIVLQGEYWYWDVPGSRNMRIFCIQEEIKLVEDETGTYERVVLASPHMKNVVEFLSDLRTVESISQQKHELTVRNRWLRNNVISSSNAIVSRILARLLGTTPSRRVLNTSKFIELVESGMSREEIERQVGAEHQEKAGKEGAVETPEAEA